MKALKTTPLAALILMIAACSPSSPPANPSSDTPPPTPSSDQPAVAMTCLDERGQAQAQNLVDRCLAVTSATRPPCNINNTCALIEDEIKRSCELYPTGQQPKDCAS